MFFLAKKAFQAVVNHLKRKRIKETKSFFEFLSDGAEDPARKDEALNQKLKKYKKDGDEKLKAVFEKYTEMQKEDAGVCSTDKSEDSEEDDDSSELKQQFLMKKKIKKLKISFGNWI